MHTFQMLRARTPDDAVRLAAASPETLPHPVRFLAGGTTLVDLMKLDVEQPQQVIDINRLPFDQVEQTADGGLNIGALVRNSDLANHPLVMQRYPVLSQALLSGASAQLRNMATTGGNLLQRTRCVYFRDTATACNKRQPGSGCAAMDGFHRNLAILGISDQCIATNPSDMNVALTALEATIHVQGAGGARMIPINDFYLLPGATPQRETVLAPGELVTHVSLTAPVANAGSTYLKLRDRASYEFALSSAAVLIGVSGGRISHARVALGGVGTRPWRSPEAEAVLQGAAPNLDTFAHAAAASVRDARTHRDNAFKVDLIQRCLVQALKVAVSPAQRSA
ncbi:FAD-binding molybdopterin dehydrogenase [Herbaspirillum sp. meg3]|uniref:FAD binding domain-containing protein n=1 Tax=Herbaspirillum sp. meg3 TaxID=2025949 RepID=UPI000B98F9B5|nr:xanthine dehydrogenase family protein subunit M [Herbaspirillum sp. meg3]ASU40979.1 FAD-binding molybdopterin dehydrogenase [Herbaspirillum sp. meg3]